jgi:hypothetical protein
MNTDKEGQNECFDKFVLRITSPSLSIKGTGR